MKRIACFIVLAGACISTRSVDAGGNDYRVAATAAARELSRQLFFLQNTISLIPGPPMGRGLFQQCENVQGALIYFQQQLKRQVSREELLLNFDTMDAKLQTLLDDIKGFEQWDTAMKMVGKRVRSAAHDLHFALSTGDGNPASSAQAAYRQTLNLLTKSENFASMVRYVFAEQNVLKQWNGELATFSEAITQLQTAQNNKAAREAAKNQLLATDQAWEKLVGRVKALPQGQFILLQSDAAQVDSVIFRLNRAFGIKEQRAPLPDPLAF